MNIILAEVKNCKNEFTTNATSNSENREIYLILKTALFQILLGFCSFENMALVTLSKYDLILITKLLSHLT